MSDLVDIGHQQRCGRPAAGRRRGGFNLSGNSALDCTVYAQCSRTAFDFQRLTLTHPLQDGRGVAGIIVGVQVISWVPEKGWLGDSLAPTRSLGFP